VRGTGRIDARACASALAAVVLLAHAPAARGAAPPEASGSADPVRAQASAPSGAARSGDPAFDGDEDEDRGLLHAPPPPPDDQAHARTWRAGARAGVFMPVAGGESWYPALSVGGYYRGALRGVDVEFGVDYTSIDHAGSSSTSQLLLIRGDALFSWRSAEGRSITFYWLAGMQLCSEWAQDTRWDTEAQNAATSVGLGAGLRPRAGTWDLRASYAIFVGTDRGSGALAVSAGVQF
jgi:hypothetical protein